MSLIDLFAEEQPRVGCVSSHFLDSGSFTLWTEAEKYAKANNAEPYAYYDTPEFYAYMDAYAAFVKEYADMIDVFANVDAIPNPELTYRNQKYLEGKGVSPVPVVHYTSDLKWLRKYIAEGYPFIALGGLVGSLTQEECRRWIDDAFNIICDQPSRLPRVKIHGFGVTSYELILRYPWYSVDSTSWTKKAAYGLVIVPHKRGGKFVFTEQPYTISISTEKTGKIRKAEQEQPKRKALIETAYTPMIRDNTTLNYLKLQKAEQDVVLEWFAKIGVPLGKLDKDGEVEVMGVATSHTYRRAANLLFYEEMLRNIPQYPWPFRGSRRVPIPGLFGGGK